MKILITSLLIFAITCCTYAQDSLAVEDQKENRYQLLFEIPGNISVFSTDIFQNIYAVDSSNILIKYTPEGKEMFRHSEIRHGIPSSLDATNPFHILLYYQDFQTVETFDNTLSKTTEFHLGDLDLDIINTVSSSSDSHLWLYDPVEFQLKKINSYSKVLLSSNDLSLEFNEAIEPNFILERENQIFVNDPMIGVLVFDLYANYIKTVELVGLENFQVLNNRIYYFKDKELLTFDLASLNHYKVTLPDGMDHNDLVRIGKNRLFIAGDSGIRVYGF